MNKMKEIKVIKEEVYKNEEGQLIKKKVIEVISEIVVPEGKLDEKERRRLYYQQHKEELNEMSRKKKVERYANDPEYREKMKAKRRENYLKKKLEKSVEDVI
jgi:hypothetical protein